MVIDVDHDGLQARKPCLIHPHCLEQHLQRSNPAHEQFVAEGIVIAANCSDTGELQHSIALVMIGLSDNKVEVRSPCCS
jgi:hypothetical protein